MFKERTPTWILTGGFLLTLGAGCINAVGFLGYHHQPISHLTGTLTQLGTDLAVSNWELAARAGLVLLSFFLGCLVSAYIIRQTALKMGRRYGGVLVLESAVLFYAHHLLTKGEMSGDLLIAFACGLQNAMATSYSGSVIRSTHMTGIVTDIGISLGQALHGQKVDWFRLRLYASLLFGFFTGSVLGTFGWEHFHYSVLLFPATAFGVSGLTYTLYKHWQRMTQVSARHV